MFRKCAWSLKSLLRGLFVLPVFLITGSCSNLEYVDNTTLKQMSQQNNRVIYEPQKGGKMPRQFGALVMGKKDAEGGPIIFTIKRYKSRYIAETMLFDNTGVKNANFEKSYLSVGGREGDFRLELKLTY